jgi:NNP family nitrate/nitrite transporter-like MFS transporter
MGYLYGQLGSYAIGLLALAVVAVAALLFDSTTVRNAVNHRSAAVTR